MPCAGGTHFILFGYLLTDIVRVYAAWCRLLHLTLLCIHRQVCVHWHKAHHHPMVRGHLGWSRGRRTLQSLAISCSCIPLVRCMLCVCQCMPCVCPIGTLCITPCCFLLHTIRTYHITTGSVLVYIYQLVHIIEWCGECIVCLCHIASLRSTFKQHCFPCNINPPHEAWYRQMLCLAMCTLSCSVCGGCGAYMVAFVICLPPSIH